VSNHPARQSRPPSERDDWPAMLCLLDDAQLVGGGRDQAGARSGLSPARCGDGGGPPEPGLGSQLWATTLGATDSEVTVYAV